MVAKVKQLNPSPPDDDWHLSLLELLHCDLQRVSLALQLNHHGRAHRDLERARAQNARALVLRHVRRRSAFGVGDLGTNWRLMVKLKCSFVLIL